MRTTRTDGLEFVANAEGLLIIIVLTHSLFDLAVRRPPG